MTSFSTFGLAGARRHWAVALLLLGLSLLLPGAAQATHIRAGDIQAKVDTTANPNFRRIFFRMVIYRDRSSGVLQNEQETNIYFGDRTAALAGNGITRTVAPNQPSPDTEILIFTFEHTYPGPGTYDVSFVGENRNANVLNMTNSVAKSFFITTRITIDPALIDPVRGPNHSPVLTAPAFDKGATGQVFLHNPAAYDADGDSLAYELIPSREVPGGAAAVGPSNIPQPVTVQGFVYPNSQSIAPGASQVAYNGVPAGQPGQPAIMVMDPITGQITWNAPAVAGLYNVALKVKEYRRAPGNTIQIGEVVRDMQIIVSATANLRPTITIPADICVVAGTNITRSVSAVDGSSPSSPQTPITLTAYGGILPPATFTQTAAGPPTALGTFSWTPDCRYVSDQPYTVVFKAQDNPTPVATNNPPLIDEKPWRITVVGPPPQNVRVVASSSSAGVTGLLTWNPYACPSASRLLIFRKENPSTWNPSACETRIPASAGYTQVGSVTAATQSFVDDNGGRGLQRGKTYCYRIYAEFPLPNGGASIASAEACLTLGGRAALITNVDVDQTDAAQGQITVRWTKPVPNSPTVPFNAPLGYRLSRGVGANPANFTLVTTLNALTDTVYVDRGLNTVANQYTYKLEFFSSNTTQPGSPQTSETSALASSVRLDATPNGLGGNVALRWSYQVPWDNTTRPAAIYRRDPGATAFTQIATAPTTATGGTYTDNSPTLRRDQTYCYYVQTNGQYPNIFWLNSLLNKSQRLCVKLSTVPCTPVLTLLGTNCDSLAALPNFPEANQRYQNRLRWTAGTDPAGCSTDAAYYRIFYRATAEGPLVLLDSTTRTSYVHRFLTDPAGCYAVQAVTAAGIRSAQSNVACQDNCVFFTLPNIFTPNGDRINDTFRPKNTSPLRRIHFQAFNRWGVKVFENTTTAADPIFINWSGGGPNGEGATSDRVSAGVYFYLAEVEFADFANTKRTYKGWVEIVR